jgi:hypothetical protein
LVTGMNRAELLEHNERSLAELLDEIAERRSRADDPHIDVREWTTPVREIPSFVTRAATRLVVSSIAEAEARIEQRLDDAMHQAGLVLGEEVALAMNPILARLRAAERTIEELKARQWAAPPQIIRP